MNIGHIFSDMFRSRWQHSKPDVRLRSVNQASRRQLEKIVILAKHDDVFRAAIDRIAGEKNHYDTDKFLYDLLIKIEKISANNKFYFENIFQRQGYIVRKITLSSILIKIIFKFRSKLALEALHNLKAVDLVGYFKNEKHVLLPHSSSVSVNSSPDIPLSSSEAYTAMWHWLDICLSNLALQQEWNYINKLIEAAETLEFKRAILMKLPGDKITFEHLRAMCVDRIGQSIPNYFRVSPFLRKMAQAGWTIREQSMQIPCTNCGNSDFPGYITHWDGSSYGCGYCGTTGLINGYEVCGELNGEQFKLTAFCD